MLIGLEATHHSPRASHQMHPQMCLCLDQMHLWRQEPWVLRRLVCAMALVITPHMSASGRRIQLQLLKYTVRVKISHSNMTQASQDKARQIEIPIIRQKKIALRGLVTEIY